MCTGALASVVYGTLGKEGWNLGGVVWGFLVGFFYTGKSHSYNSKISKGVAQASTVCRNII